MRLRAASVVAMGICVLGCRSPSTDAHTAPSAVPGASSSSAAASAAASSSSTPPKLPYAFDRGCAGDIDKKVSPSEQLAALGRQCAAGLPRVDMWKEPLELRADEAKPLSIDLAKHACVRMGAATSRPGAVLRLTLEDPDGRTVADSENAHAPMLLPFAGPVCVERAGTYGVQVRSVGAEAKIRLGVWRSEAPPPAASSN